MDIDHIKTLVELMVTNDIHRIEWHDGDKKVLLRRGGPVAAPVIMPAPPASSTFHAPHHSASGAAHASSTAHDAPPPAHADEIVIRSPMVGTFYTAPEPDAPPFVSVGSNIGPDTVVCLIEAMKVFNEIKAEVSGRISRVLVKNAQAVEFDQPLFVLTPG